MKNKLILILSLCFLTACSIKGNINISQGESEGKGDIKETTDVSTDTDADVSALPGI